MFKKLFIIFIILTSCSRNKHDDKIISSPEILLDRDLSLVKQIIFNNELRENNGMPKVDSVMFIQDSIISKNKVSYIRKFSKNQSNEIINVEFYHKRGDSLVFDSYKVGNDSIIRIQSRIKNGKFIKNIHAILFTKLKNHFLSLEEIIDIARKNKLYHENDTIFYGYNVSNKGNVIDL